MRHPLRGIVAAVLAFTILGCSEGQILVDRPEVFTRERLVTRRLKEVQWLEGKLNAPYTPSIQGYNDVREFSGLLAKLQGQFDPLGGKLAAVQETKSVADVQRSEQLAQLQQQVSILNLKQQLQAAKQNPTTTGPGAGGAGPAPATGTGAGGATTPPSAGTTDNSTSSNLTDSSLTSVGTAGSDLSVFGTSNKPTLPAPADLQASQAQITAVDALNDEAAYRDAIQARLREQELDDTHDSRGYTLYTLKFDITVIPHGQTDQIGTVTLDLHSDNTSFPDTKKLPDPSDPKWQDLFSTYLSWHDAFRRDVQQEALGLQHRWMMGALTDEDRVEIATYVNQANANPAPMALRRSRAIAKLTNDVKNRQNPGDAAVYFVEHRYQRLQDEGLITFGEPETFGDFSIPQVNAPGKLSDIKTDKEFGAFYGFIQRVEAVEGKATNVTVQANGPGFSMSFLLPGLVQPETQSRTEFAPYVYSVEPKEFAQNISDVAAAEKLDNFILALRAALPQFGLNASAGMNSIKDEQHRIEAILRKPLVVAFANSDTQFGWVIGPRFTIGSGGQVAFEQATVQHSVQVNIAVPAWRKSVQIHGRYKWGNGREIPLWPHFDKSTMTVEMPADPSALTRTMVAALEGFERHAPKIYPPWDDNAKQRKIVLLATQSQKQSILIRGSDLWRNPEVFVGAQKADSLEVLPDMRGLLATFNTLPAPANATGDGIDTDLTVVTSAGSDVLKDGVHIILNSAMQPAAAGSIASNFVVGSGPLLIKVDPTKVPASYTSLQLRVRPSDSAGSWASTDPVAWNSTKDVATFNLNVKDTSGAVPGWMTDHTREITAEFQLKRTPDGDPEYIPLVGKNSFIHVLTQADTGVKIETATRTITFPQSGNPTPLQLLIDFPADWQSVPTPPTFELFYKMYPGLKDALGAGKATLELSVPGQPNIEVPLKAAPTGAACDAIAFDKAHAVPAHDPTKDTSATYSNANIAYPAGISIPTDMSAASQLTLKRAQ